MQKFEGKIGKLFDVITGFGISDTPLISEEVFKEAIKDHDWIYLEDEDKNSLGYFNKFWVGEVDGVKYVYGSGFIFDNVDFSKVNALKNFVQVNDAEHSSFELATGENAE